MQLHAQGIVLRDVVAGAEVKTKTQQVCQSGEFLVAEIDAKVGGFGIVPDELGGAIVSSHYFLFGIDENALDRRFLNYYIRTPAFRDQVSAQGSTNYAAIRPAHVLEYCIPLPPLAEQQRIVARIETLAARIAEARGLRQQVVEEISALSNAELDSTFSEINASYLPIIVGKAGGYVTSGPRGWGEFYDPDGSRRLIRVENVWNRELNLTEAAKVTLPENAGDIERSQVQAGDVLVTITGAIGRVGVVRKFDLPCHVSQHVALVRPPSSILPDYLYWYLQSPSYGRTQTEGNTYGATKPGINLTSLRMLTIATPPLDEQRRIVAYLDGVQAKVDAVRRLQAETAAELGALLPAVLDRAFRGEL